MNDLSNERLKEIVETAVSQERVSMARELLAYREAQGKAVAVTGEDEISNMQVTGLYLRAWPTCRQRNEVEGYTIPLYTSPQLPAVPDGWKLLPIEPTPEMLNASWVHHGIYAPSVWRAMLAAAPKLYSDNVTDSASQQFESLSSGSKNE